ISHPRDTVVVPPASRVFVVAGIARPDRFVADVASAGWDISGVMQFHDHHPFDARDVARIAAEARAKGAAIVPTTEKDAGRHGAHRRIAHRNRAAAFPTRSDRERRAIARAAFGHFGRLLFELLRFATLTKDEMLACVEVDGAERSRLAYAQGKGVLFVTGHFGYWEIQAMVHALQVEPVSILARALDNPYLNRLLETIRQRTGNTVVYRRGTIRRVLRTLHEGRGVALLIDQHILSRDAIY